jgi:ribosomal-protein-alanine N-acetyltransferase
MCYAIASDAWGLGYTGEALPPLVAFGFRGLDLVRQHATIDPRNRASARVLERLGFRHEGTRREHSIMRGEVGDDALYGLLRREWESSAP